MFITLEGPDGSGKTTVLDHLKKKLKISNLLFTREPGGLEIAEEIRDLILNDKSANMDSWTEVLLYLAARREHLTKLIIPALEAGKTVISDRFMDSTSVYQGYARGLDLNKIDQLQRMIIGDYVPDLTIYFRVDLQETKRRLTKIHKNRFDRESEIFKQNVLEGYEKLILKDPQRFKIVDANQPLDKVVEIVEKIIKETLNRGHNQRLSKLD